MKLFREIFLTLKSRYLATLTRTGAPLGLGENIVGYIESASPDNGQLRLAGWYAGKPVQARINGYYVDMERQIYRDDVAIALDITNGKKTGFEIFVTPARQISLKIQGDKQHHDLVLFSIADKFRAALSTLVFLPKILVLHPSIVFRFLVFNDRAAAGFLENLLLPENKPPQSGGFDMSIFDPSPNRKLTEDQSEIAIILPVFNSFELLKECLTRVITHTTPPYRLIMVEDCSTDPTIRPWLRQWVKSRNGTVTLLENHQNLGFIGSVNRGLAEAGDCHVVLLNSDALVPQNWLPRLMRPIFESRKIASTTPLSNNAEILSLPIICKENQLVDGAVDRIDQIAKTLNSRQPALEIPTGIGFCMGMSKYFLQKVPQLDRRFGKGYGEEVDWCQKTRALGGVHMAVANLFVHHKGGESFGPEKQVQLAKNNAVISRLYPRYDQLVRDFSAADPLKSTRFALGIPAIDIGKPVPVYLCHNLGGGTEVYLKQKIRTDLAAGQGAIVIRDAINGHGYVMEIHTSQGITASQINGFKELTKLLALLRMRVFYYTCLVGARDALGFLKDICALLIPKKDSLIVQMHDFFPICPSYNLLDMDAKFCSVPMVSKCEDCYRKKIPASGSMPENINEWRNAWQEILTCASQIEVFSNSSKNIFAKAYPRHTGKIIVLPHDLPVRPAKIINKNPAKPIIGVLGNIGFNKGAGFIHAAANVIQPKDAKIIVVGKLDPKYSHRNITVTGAYQVSKLDRIAKANGINCWLIPSIWPETFSYTTHEALKTGLPVFAFDLGAQGEAVQKVPNGHIISDNPLTLLAQIESQMAKSKPRLDAGQRQ